MGLCMLSEWAVQEIGDSVRSRRALCRREETWVCFQHEEKEPGGRQKWEIREMGDIRVGRDGTKAQGDRLALQDHLCPRKASSSPHLIWCLPRKCCSKSVLGPEALLSPEVLVAKSLALPSYLLNQNLHSNEIAGHAYKSLRSAALKQWF